MVAKKSLDARFCTIALVTVMLLAALSGAYSALIASFTITSAGQISSAPQSFYAASGSASAIQSAVNQASSAGGGDVYVPAGTWTWSGSDEVSVPGGVNVFGASPGGNQGHENNWAPYTAETVLRRTSLSSASFFDINGANGRPTRISGFRLEDPAPSSASQEDTGAIAIFLDRAKNYRIDHITFINFPSMAVFADANTGTPLAGSSYGLIDHCTVDNPYKQSGSGWLWGYGFYARGNLYGYSYWDHDETHFLGYYGQRAGYSIMYVEDCRFSRTRHATDGIDGAWVVSRYNLFENPYPNDYPQISLHGTSRGMEAYYNTMISNSQTNNFINWRGGSGVAFNNTFSSTSSSDTLVLLGNDGFIQGNWAGAGIRKVYIWSNNYGSAQNVRVNQGTLYQNQDYFLREPTQSQDGYTYTPYPYPHPLTLT